MKPPQFLIAIILSILPLVLALYLALIPGRQNQDLQNQFATLQDQVDSKQEHLLAQQTQLQAQQEEINKGATSQQIGVNLLKEIAAASVKDENLKDVLTKSGYTVTVNASPTPAPSATP